MKNSKGFGTREILIVVLLMLSISAFLAATLLGGSNEHKILTFKENASTFTKTIVTNQASFFNVDVIYLGEAINEGFMKDIKNTLGSGNCDPNSSKVVFKDGKTYTTFKCGKYMIDNVEIKTLDNLEIYEVSEWTDKKLTGKDVEEITLYNCTEGDKVVFDEYYEEVYLIYKVNDLYNESARTLDGIERKTALKVIEKTFYRTKKKADLK